MEYVAGAVLYMVLGAAVTFLTWDEDRDEWYGDLSVNGRWLFFARGLFLWPPFLLYDIMRRRKKGPAEE